MTQLRIIPQGGFSYDRPDPFRIYRAARLRVARAGRGGAAALTGALAASLAAMAANVTAANPRYAERTDALATLAAACDAQRTALLTLIDADAAGFLPLQRAYAIPKTDPERAAALADAARTACQTRWICWRTASRWRCCWPPYSRRPAPSCARTSGVLRPVPRAAAEAAAMNVFVNTGLLAPADRAETEARAEHLRATVVQCCARTVEAVFAALRGEG